MDNKPDLTFIAMAMIAIAGVIFYTYSFFQDVVKPPSTDTRTTSEVVSTITTTPVQKTPDQPQAKTVKTVSEVVSSDKDLYTKNCASCHNAGIAGAPKPHIEADWSNRNPTDVDGLIKSVVAGKGIMPPKGGCIACSNDDLKTIINYMVEFK